MNFIKTHRHTFFIGLLTAVSLLLFAGLCIFFFSHSGLPLQENASPAAEEDAAFTRFTGEVFTESTSCSTLTLHYTLRNPAAFGISGADAPFENYEPRSAAKEDPKLRLQLTRLHRFSREELNPDNRLTYDIMDYSLTKQLALSSFGLFSEPFSPTLGIQAQLPVLLAEYRLESPADTDSYLELLNASDEYFESFLIFEYEKSNAGLFMSAETAEAVIRQCRAFIAEPDTNFLITGFPERIASVPFSSPAQREACIRAAEDGVRHHLIPAYEKLIECLTYLKDTGTNTYGLCYYENGRRYYEALIASEIGSDRSVPEIRQLLEDRINIDFEIIHDVLLEDPDLVQAALSGQLPASSDTPLMMLETLQQKTSADFPAIDAEDYTVREVCPALQDSLSPAFYLTPPLDSRDQHTIYINPAAGSDPISLFATLAHEGWPGHLYQTLWENASRTDPVRSLYCCGGFIEGWATYAERCAYACSSLDSNTAALLAANNSISLGIYALTDLGIHYDGWTPEDTAARLADFGITSPEACSSIYQAVLENPGNYLKYFLGYAETEKIKEQANAALGDSFNLKEFHRFLLSTGPAPFPVLAKQLLLWIDTQTSVSPKE